MKLKIRPCPIVEKDHKKSLRAYFHYGHHQNVVCTSQSSYKLPLQHSLALLLHEIGHHLMSGGTEEEANEVIRDLTGIKIKYVRETPYGNRLQYIKKKDVNRVYGFLREFIEMKSLRPFIY
jgi:hypothetical protein